MNLEFLKPGEEEIRLLALRETDPRHAAEFAPISRGPLVAVLLLGWAGLCSLPGLAVRSMRQFVRKDR